MKSNKKNPRIKFQKTKKKKFRKKISSYQSQKGSGGEEGGKSEHLISKLEKRCVNVMNVLEEDATNKTKYNTALESFLRKNKNLNKFFFNPALAVTGRKKKPVPLPRKRQDTAPPRAPPRAQSKINIEEELPSYQENLNLRVDYFKSSENKRNIVTLDSHSSYGSDYFPLPPNISVCFLTAANKFAINEFDNRKDYFSPEFPQEERKKIFESIFAYSTQYFDKSEFSCFIREKKHVCMDYFREASWYFPGQLCSNSGISMSREEFEKKPRFYNFFLVDDTSYQTQINNSLIKTHFDNASQTQFNFNLKEIVTSDMFKPYINYVVLVTGCRTLSKFPRGYQSDTHYNFIHYHLTQEVLKDLPNEVDYVDIPSYICTFKPRDYMNYYLFDSHIETFKQDIVANPFTFNNHLIYHLLEKLEQSQYQNSDFYADFKNFVLTLNYDKMLMLYHHIANNLGDKPVSILEEIFGVDMLTHKFEILTGTINKLLGQPRDNYSLMPKFDGDIIASMIKRTQHFQKLINLIGGQEFITNYESQIPTMLGISYLNNRFYFESGGSLNIGEPKSGALNSLVIRISKRNIEECITKIASIPESQSRVVFYECDFNRKQLNFQNQKIKHLLFLKCPRLKLASDINLNCELIELREVQLTGRCFCENARRIIMTSVLTTMLTVMGSNITHLDLDLKDGSSLGLSFDCPQLQSISLKNANGRSFTMGNSTRLEKIEFENINFNGNTSWKFSDFPNLKNISLTNFKCSSAFDTKSGIINLEFLKLIGMEINMTQLSTTILKSPRLIEIFLTCITEVVDDLDDASYITLVSHLKEHNVDVIVDTTLPILDEAFF